MRIHLLPLLWLGSTLAFAQRPDPGPTPRPDPAREAELKSIVPLTTGVREDDYPAVAAAAGGAAWVAWLSYSEAENAADVFLRSFAKGAWSAPERATEKAGDCHKPAVAVDSAGAVWVAWPAQVSGNWDI